MRIFILLFLLIGWMPAIDLVVNSDFATNEDEVLIFSFDELMAKCTISNGTEAGFKISAIGIDGDLKIANSATGPWDTAPIAGSTVFLTGQYLRYVPTTNLNGADVNMLTIRARDFVGFESAPGRPVNVDIAALDDPITAASHEFVQPGAGPPDYRIKEDNLNAWTFQQLKDTLLINDVEGQPWTLRITGKVSGTLKTAGDVEITTFPTDLTFTALGDVAVKWQPPADVFTKTGPPAEDALVAFTARAITTTAPITTSSEVTLTTPVLGIPDPVVSPTVTTLGAIAPLVVTRGTTTTFTYEQLHALCSGTNDVDREGTLTLRFDGTAISGCIINQFDAFGNFWATRTAPSPITLVILVNERIQIIVPDSVAGGIQAAGVGDLYITGSGGTSTPLVPLSLDVRIPPPGGGSNGASSDSGGGGGCGAGTAGAGLISLLFLSLRRRNKAT